VPDASVPMLAREEGVRRGWMRSSVAAASYKIRRTVLLLCPTRQGFHAGARECEGTPEVGSIDFPPLGGKVGERGWRELLLGLPSP